MRRGIVLCIALLAVLLGLADQAEAKPRKRVRAPAPTGHVALRGSLAAQATENAVADRWKLERYRSLQALLASRERGELVRVHGSGAVRLSDDVGEYDRRNPEAYAYARPWVVRFLRALANDATLPPGAVFEITSLVRTEYYQRLLRRHNANAAKGVTPAQRSSHLTGSTVDITTKKMSPELKSWMRRKLVQLERAGKIQATEERRRSACFHVMVFPDFQ